jgi:phage shock protein PspC (stress-responsive transcriptional regulator)
MQVAGYNPFLGKTMSRKSAHSITGGSDTFLQHFGILRRGFVNQYDTERNIVKQINKYKPDFLYMNKSEFMRICLYCKQHKVKLRKPKFYCPTGEKIDDTARKLFRDPDGKKIGGVCSGIALFLNVDVVLIRVIFLIALICGSAGFWIYLIILIAAPEARTAAEKCELRGIPATAENIKRFTKGF